MATTPPVRVNDATTFLVALKPEALESTESQFSPENDAELAMLGLMRHRVAQPEAGRHGHQWDLPEFSSGDSRSLPLAGIGCPGQPEQRICASADEVGPHAQESLGA